MFKPRTNKIAKISLDNHKVISELEFLFKGNVFMYMDYANVRPWAEKLKWKIDVKRLKQFLDSFDNLKEIKFYHGTLDGEEKSKKEIRKLEDLKYITRTKPVKVMSLSINVTSISSMKDRSLLRQFIRKALLRKYDGETVEYLNKCFEEMNKAGEYKIEDRKCNFDVEIGLDMLMDPENRRVDTVVLWSGDSDFHDPLRKLLEKNKNVILFATAGKVSRELDSLRSKKLLIFDIKKIKDFICWNRDISNKYKAKETLSGL